MSYFKPVCSFGESCDRLQEKHFSDYHHPHCKCLVGDFYPSIFKHNNEKIFNLIASVS